MVWKNETSLKRIFHRYVDVGEFGYDVNLEVNCKTPVTQLVANSKDLKNTCI